MKSILNYCLLALPLAAMMSQTSCTTPEPVQPNILFIFADDQSYNTIHAHGNEQVITPNIDRLAEKGTSFSHAYNMGGWNGAICVASRTMMNTGRFVWSA